MTMNRLNIQQSIMDSLRTTVQSFPEYQGKSTPLPGTALKLDDDIEWLGILKGRVLWGYETPDYFFCYCPEIDLDGYTYFDGIYVTDRAPADPQETPMPIYPQQAQQKQHGPKYDPKRALHDLLNRLDHDAQKKLRALVRERKPELLDEKHL